MLSSGKKKSKLGKAFEYISHASGLRWSYISGLWIFSAVKQLYHVANPMTSEAALPIHTKMCAKLHKAQTSEQNTHYYIGEM